MDTVTKIYSGKPQKVLRGSAQYMILVPAGTRVQLRDLSFNGDEPIYICRGLRYAVRRGACGWETTGQVIQ